MMNLGQKLSDHKHTLFLLLLLLPLFFINIQNVHNWGDDFALYLHQAKNIVEGESPQETGFVYNEDNPIMVGSVSIGFSLMLAPVYAIWHGNIKVYSYYITLYLVLAALTIFYFYRKRFPFLLAGLLVLLIAYNRWILQFKYNILSDIPFLFLLILLFNLFDKKWKNNYVKMIVIGVMAGFLTSVRTLGLVFTLAVMVSVMFDLVSYRLSAGSCAVDARKKIIGLGLFTIISFGVFKLLNIAFFPDTEHGSYMGYMQEHNLVSVFVDHLNYYFSYFSTFFNTFKIPLILHIVNIVFVCVFLISGFVVKLARKVEVHEFFFIGYLLVVLAYPANPGFRYLLPLVPFVFLYMVEGFQYLAKLLKQNKKHVWAYGFFLFLLFQYEPGIARMTQKEKLAPIYGPQLPAAVKVFEFIKENIPDSSVFVFVKPRALSFYTDMNCLANNKYQRNADTLDDIYKDLGVDYLLQNVKEIKDSAMIVYLEKFEYKLDLVYENRRFKLYKFKAH
ncbi:hypothetical protein ACFLRI_03155 [Bacteroidota bacterium]